MVNCKKCNTEHEGKYGSGIFCSSFCARSFAALVNREQRNKIVSEKLKGKPGKNKGIPLSDETKRKISLGNKGKKRPNKIPNELVFVRNSNHGRHRIKERLIKENLIAYVCAECGLNDNWNGKKLSLQLDHINGIGNDNRLENLRFLCPNCHTQQETYASKNRIYQKKIGVKH